MELNNNQTSNLIPEITVILPTYNRANYLVRSISSFINQTFQDTDLVIIDDGSTDNSYDVVSKFMAKHPNIRYFKQENQKTAAAKNAGIKVAKGNYITFLDSDDEYQSTYLEHKLSYMQSHPEFDLIESGAKIIGNQYVKDYYDLSKKIHLSKCHIGSTFFGKAKVFKTLGGFNKDLPYGDDNEFWERAKRTFKVKKVIIPGYIYYRDTPDSICNDI